MADSVDSRQAAPLQSEVTDPLAAGTGWDCEISQFPESNVFHSAAWARVLSRTYRHVPVYQRFYRAGQTVALVPIMEVKSPLTGCRGVCLPFSDACAPLFGDDRSDLAAVREELASLARVRRWKSLELRGGENTDPTFYEHSLELEADIDKQLGSCSSSARRAIRKAQGSGLTIRCEYGEAGMLGFYKLHTRTRKRHGLPPQPFAFFRNILEEGLVGKGSGFIILAESAGRPVSAAVFLVREESAVYKFGASEAAHWPKRPNNLIMWEAICELVGRGIRSLNFGRTSVWQDGLRRFKRSWGSTEKSLTYSSYDVSKSEWSAVISRQGHRMVQGVFSHMPLALNRIAGAMLYPHLD